MAEIADPPQKYAPRIVKTCELDAAGNIKRIFNVLPTRKLTTTPEFAQIHQLQKTQKLVEDNQTHLLRDDPIMTLEKHREASA
ncbi:MAG: hypothetical protein J2P21_05045 [Chloracidobacterium sp.]|nr:hypothetical protein [Chloracidobacterium sp.]